MKQLFWVFFWTLATIVCFTIALTINPIFLIPAVIAFLSAVDATFNLN